MRWTKEGPIAPGGGGGLPVVIIKVAARMPGGGGGAMAERIQREHREAEAEQRREREAEADVLGFGQRELACPAATAHTMDAGIFVNGCGRQARYHRTTSEV